MLTRGAAVVEDQESAQALGKQAWPVSSECIY